MIRLENQKMRALKESAKRDPINIRRQYFRKTLLTEFIRRTNVSAWEMQDIDNGGWYHLQ